MAQKNVVKAFRKRMKSFGYADVSIKLLENGLYRVSAIEPLAGVIICIEYSTTQMQVAFRRIKGNVMTVYRDTVRRDTYQQVTQMGHLPASNPDGTLTSK